MKVSDQVATGTGTALRVSVVIPTYNRAREVVEAVRSVQAQTFRAFETIVVDDGSTDGTAEQFANPAAGIRYFRTTNGGVSAARNFGIRMAEGEWVAFLDSDDQWHPEKLARQVECVTMNQASVCFTGCADETGQRLDDLPAMDPSLQAGASGGYPAGDYRLFRHSRHPYVQTALVRRAALLEAGLFDESLRVAEDTKLIYALVMRYGFGAVNEPLVTICRDRGSAGLSDDIDPEVALIRYECYSRVQSEFYWQMLGRDPAVARVLREQLGYFLSRWAEIACATGRSRQARSVARQGLACVTGWKNLLRSLAIFLAPGFMHPVFSRKWRPRKP
jgi:glycosyltransferase involved in cell wall biosynthesis